MKKGQVIPRLDEFAIILLAGIVLIIIFTLVWAPTAEVPPEVSPTSKSLPLTNGTTSTFDLEIIGYLTNVTLTATGEISTWISFSKNVPFDVTNRTTVKVTVRVPSRVSFRTYSGAIEVESTGGKKRVPITITITEVPVALIASPFPLGDFSVSSTETSKTLDSKENLEISKGYFSEKYASLVGMINERDLPLVIEASVRLVVEDTNNLGNLIVLLDGQEIFNQKVSVGETVVPINASQVKRSSVITIKASNPGWMFWASTYYKIRLAEFTIDLKGVLSQEFPFTVSQDQLTNFQELRVFFRIKDFSQPMPTLAITINAQTLFIGKPELFFNRNFTKDILANPIFLTVGENKIKFSLEEKGHIDLADTNLVLYFRG